MGCFSHMEAPGLIVEVADDGTNVTAVQYDNRTERERTVYIIDTDTQETARVPIKANTAETVSVIVTIPIVTGLVQLT